MKTPSLLRLAEHEALSTLQLDGRVLDLGGEKNSGYLSHIRGKFVVTTINNDSTAHPDIVHDLEKPIPLEDESFEHVLLINVLEHIYNYKQLLLESKRVVKSGGSIVVVVPFLFPIHPSPNDYWRFTGHTLERLFKEAGLNEISVTPLGRGVFSARFIMLDRLLPSSIRILNHYVCRYFIFLFDGLWFSLARMLGKKYRPEDYSLGYLAIGEK